MFNFKNFTRTSATALIALSMLSTVPMLASANNGVGLNLGLETSAHTNSGLHLGKIFHANAKANVNNDNDNANNKTDASLKAQFGADVKAAADTFKQAVKDANQTFKTTKASAQATFKASVNTATDQAGKIAALKTYLNSAMVAMQVKSASMTTAFQAFINAKFNQAPTANAQSVTVAKNSSVAITLAGSDPENSLLAYTIVNTTAHGTLSGTAPNLTYTPAANFTGTDSFTFKVNDGNLFSTLATVTITVNP